MMRQRKGSVPRTDASCSTGSDGSRADGKVPRRELVKLLDETKQLWQTFLLYLAVYGVRQRRFERSSTKRTTQDERQPYLDRFFIWLARHTGGNKKNGAAEVHRRSEESDGASSPVGKEAEPAAQISNVALALWIPALLFYGFGDVLTSALAFAVGAQEANPLARVFVELPGGIWIFALVKTVILVSLLFLAHYGLKRYYWIVPVVLTMVGGYLAGHNVLVFMQVR